MAIIFPTLDNIQRLKQKPTEGEWFLINYLITHLPNEVELYFQPFLNGDRPDIILMQKGRGVTVIEVKDWNLSSYIINAKNQWSLSTDGTKIRSPFQQVYYYKDQLFNIHIEGLLEKKLKNKKFYGRIKPYVYFHGASKQDLVKLAEFAKLQIKNEENKCHEQFKQKNITEANYNKCLDYWKNQKNKIDRDFKQVILISDYSNNIFLPPEQNSELFTDEIYREFHRVLQPPSHTIEEGRDIFYTKKQIRLSTSIVDSAMKIKGVAGSGKTTVLAKRAVNAYRRHGERVLILTFNLTLVNYIHDKISDVREGFGWSYFYIDNYHAFLKTAINNTDKENFSFSDYDNENILDGFEHELLKYDTILIDEVQDYKPVWIKIIKKYFLAKAGEIVLFGDEKQNIYNRELEKDTKRINIPNGFGRWEELKTSIRFQGDGGRVLQLAKKFQKAFFRGKYEVDENEKLSTENFLDIGLFNVKDLSHDVKDDLYYKIAEDIHKKIKEYSIHPDDVVILSSKIFAVRNVEYYLRKNFKQKCKTTFETEEMYRKIVQQEDIVNPYDEEENNKLKQIRRNKKRHFHFHSGEIKLSTIHSFKGAESQTVFLITAGYPHEDEEHIYTAITRCKFNLQVYLTTNNSQFNEFFLNELNLDTEENETNTMDILKTAVSEMKKINFLYDVHGKKTMLSNVKPYKILFMNDNYYLACEVDNEYKFSMFRVNKISNVTLNDSKFYYNIDIQNFVSDIQTPFSRYSENYKESMVKILVEVDEKKAHFFETKKFLPSQNIEEKLSNGNLLISFKVTQELEVEDLIKKWLPNLKIIEPLSLDEKIKSDIQKYLYN